MKNAAWMNKMAKNTRKLITTADDAQILMKHQCSYSWDRQREKFFFCYCKTEISRIITSLHWTNWVVWDVIIWPISHNMYSSCLFNVFSNAKNIIFIRTMYSFCVQILFTIFIEWRIFFYFWASEAKIYAMRNISF